MNLSDHINKKSIALPFLISLLVVALQIQWTLSISNWQIRVSLSDFVMPLLLLLFIWVKGKSQRLNWSFSWLPLWLFVFSGWLGVSLLKGFFDSGTISNWAFFNKFIGWFILVGYLVVGNYISQFREQKFLEDSVLKVLFISAACISLFSLGTGILFNFGIRPSVGINTMARFTGFLDNPNAYGLFCVFVVLLQIPFIKSKRFFPFYLHIPVILLNSVSVICSGSRSAWLALLVGLGVGLYFKSFKLRQLLLIVGFAIFALFALNLTKTNEYLSNKKDHFINFDHAILERLESSKQALDWWQKEPLVGIGLGQYLTKQSENVVMMPLMTIHNTLLWLLTETGVIGLSLFLIFLLKTVQVVMRKRRCSEESRLAEGIFAIILGFFAGSLTTEVLYQRYLWLFLGMVLVQRQSSQSVFSRLRQGYGGQASLAFLPAEAAIAAKVGAPKLTKDNPGSYD